MDKETINSRLHYFKLEEFEYSSTAHSYKITNFVPSELLANAFYTLSNLDLLRNEFGAPIIITSGYRNPQVNKLVNGSPKSKHMQALAVDITPSDIHLLDSLKKFIKRNQYKFHITKYIEYPNFIHIQFS